MTKTSLPDIFGALADSTRVAIVERLLTEGERSTGEIAAPFAITRPAISKHLRMLEAAGLIERRVDRQWRRVRVRAETIRAVDRWVARYRQSWGTPPDRFDVFDVGADGADATASDPDDTAAGHVFARPNKPRDIHTVLAYEEIMIRAAATYFGFWFSYPHTLAEAGARSI
jgi:DNA-binding transcriptional ArsR family regulator